MDTDISKKFFVLSTDINRFDQATKAIEKAISQGKEIYILAAEQREDWLFNLEFLFGGLFGKE